MDTLYPVILAVPETFTGLPRAERSAWLSGYARLALSLSAEKSGRLLPQKLPRDEKGAPRPIGDIRWSVSHKEEFVAGVLNTGRIGIDVEKIKPVSPALVKKIVQPEEQPLFSQIDRFCFFRCWTAKEAALKAQGSGLAGLARCRVTAVINDTCLMVTVNSTDHGKPGDPNRDPARTWRISHCYFNGHVAAVAAEAEQPCCWTILNDRREPLAAERG